MTDARKIAEGLGAKWTGRGAMARCPAHEDRSPSLSINQTRDGRPLVYCHAGCSQAAVIDALRSRGLWDGEAVEDPAAPGYLSTRRDGLDADERKRSEAAKSMFDGARPIGGTLVETYLRARRIRKGLTAADLRFLPSAKHVPSGKSWPCMVGAIRDRRGTITAVQRTFLARDGSDKAPVKQAKMSLGPMGRGAVKLFQPDQVLGLAEGIETALSAVALYHLPVWATLSANRLASIDMPPTVRQLVIFADGGKVGVDQAFQAQDAYEERGIQVEVITPAAHFSQAGGDFNDVLRAGA